MLESADYCRDEPFILSAGMGFDNALGLPELTEEVVRGTGGAWYEPTTCTDGEEFLTSGAAARGIASHSIALAERSFTSDASI